MEVLITSIFATHHPSWGDVQALLNNTLLMVGERWLAINKVNEEAQENPNGTHNPARVIPLKNTTGT